MQWAQTFVNVVGGAEAAYGVPTALMTQFTTLNTALQAAWTTAQEPSTRTRATVAAATNALKAMRASAKGLVSIIQGTPGVTDSMKIDAGLTVRKTNPTPKPPPGASPFIKVTSVEGRNVTLELQQSRSKRGRPADAILATVLTSVADESPLSPDQWRFATNTSRTSVTLPFAASATGDTVWITAFWTNARAESGPAATPVSVNLPAGGVVRTEAGSSPKLRKAA